MLLVALFISIAAAAPIHLKGNKFDPGKQETSEAQQFSTTSTTTDTGYKLLQFTGPVTQDYRDLIKEKGVKFKSYIPENAWIVKLNGRRSEIISQDKVRYVGPYRSEYKIAPGVEKKGTGEKNFQVEMFKSQRDVLEKYGEVEKTGPGIWRLKTSPDNLSSVAEEPEVKWIAPEPPEPTTFNDKSRELINVNPIQETPYNLTGKGFTAAMWDGGWAGMHEDLNQTLDWAGTSKTIKGDENNCSNNNPYCQVRGHPTHVAGTMLGNGTIGDSYRGMAPDSRLITYEWPDNGTGYLNEIYTETNDSVVSYDSVLSQNSWGWGINDTDSDNTNDHDLMGDYDYVSAAYDNITANNSNINPISIVFAAGNEGDNINTPANQWHTRYNTSTGPGATAKNAITVGAVDDSGDMTNYSSWGPTDDGRIKPTLVAAGGSEDSGTLIASTLPSTNQYYPYGATAGTSMAAPAVSGAVILLNQKFNRTYDRLPAPATAKGLLIHTAQDLNRTGPDYVTGWGLVNATAVVDYINETKSSDLIKKGSLGQGDKDTFTVEVPQSESVKFTLVWSDYPASSVAGGTLVNDLDLVVKNGNSERKYPWTLSWENRTQEALKTQEDHTNPVEQVHVSSTSTGSYEVTVNGSGINEGPQDYSLLISSKKLDTTSPGVSVESPLNETYAEIPDFNVSANESLTEAVFSVDESKNYSMQEKNSTYFYNWSADLSNGSQEAVFWGKDNGDNWASDNVSFTVDTEKPSITPEKPVEAANLSGNFTINATWQDVYTDVETHNYSILNGSEQKPDELNASINSTAFADGKYNISYYAEDSAGNSAEERREVTIDNSKPSIKFHSVKEGDAFNENFTVNASWGDETSGVSNAIYELQNGSLQDSDQLNGTINVSGLSDGYYNLSYNISDFAGNQRVETVNITLDREEPFIEPLRPINDSFIDSNQTLEAFWHDDLTEANASYTVSNGSEQVQGELNSSNPNINLSDGEIDIVYTATDSAGTSNSTTLNVTLDTERPEVKILSPESPVKGEFSFEAVFSDENGVNRYNYSVFNGTVVENGSRNHSINSSDYPDGEYLLNATATDAAGKIGWNTTNITFDNSPPENLSYSVNAGDYVSGEVGFEAIFEDITGVNYSRFRFSNSTWNASWQQSNTSFDTTGLQEISYNISVEANDSLGNLYTDTVEDVTVDNTDPTINLTEYNLTAEEDGWINDSKTVEVNCSDELSGVDEAEFDDQNESPPTNFTLYESGQKSYTFTCKDLAGNEETADRIYKIDSNAPDLDSLNPSNNSDTDRSTTVKVEFNDESLESGLNLSESSVSVSKGDSNVDWSNSSFNVSVDSLSYSQSFEIDARLEDNLGHVETFTATYQVKDDPNAGETDEGGDDSTSTGGGVPTTENTSNEEDEQNETKTTDNTTQEDSSSNEIVDDTGNDANTCSGVDAIGPKEEDCKNFDNCQVPSDWSEVDSCSDWREQKAKDLIQGAKNSGLEVSEAEEAFEQGDYSQAIEKASQAIEAKDEDGGLGVLTVILALAILTVLSYLVYISIDYYRRKKLIQELNQVSEEAARNNPEGINPDRGRLLQQAEEAVHNENFGAARSLLDKFKE